MAALPAAMRNVPGYDPASPERLRELLKLIVQVLDQPSALELLESLLRYDVQGTRQLDEPAVRALLQETGRGEPLRARIAAIDAETLLIW